MMQSAIIGKQYKAGRILIQSSYRINAIRQINQIGYHLFSRMTARGHYTHWFVQRQINQSRRNSDHLSIKFYSILFDIYFNAQFGDNLPIDAYGENRFQLRTLASASVPAP